jgi:hypothetical protein
VKEFLAVLSIGLIIATYQMYLTVAKHESWAWLGVVALTAVIAIALYLDSKHDR